MPWGGSEALRFLRPGERKLSSIERDTPVAPGLAGRRRYFVRP
jgi:hypothetical protein